MPSSLHAAVLVDTLAAPAGPWTRVDVCERVDSTNAVSLAEPVPWRVLVAEQQDAGRGRHSRAWVSPAGASVAMSMTVPLPPRPDEWGWIPLVTGLAVKDALVRVGGERLEVALKWPNDVLVRRAGSDRELRKVCGILCESAGQSVVAGVGINVTVPEQELPVPTATSLHLEGLHADDAREQIVIAVAEAFAARFAALSNGGPYLAGLRRNYHDACSTIGADVRLHVPGEAADVAGRAVDVDESGRLVVDVASGGSLDGGIDRRAFAAGDVVHVRRVQQA